MRDPEPGVDALLLGGLDRFLAGPEMPAFLDEVADLRIVAGEALGQRVIGRERAEARAEDRVRAGRVDAQALLARAGRAAEEVELDEGALGEIGRAHV